MSSLFDKKLDKLFILSFPAFYATAYDLRQVIFFSLFDAFVPVIFSFYLSYYYI